ncbi:hypothetical protein Nepgr_031388 [Nepenthes gracilis]|uniref:Uncharacterized protein n=1 Tax=Nepenthes gracilis TaxID=150966 RepID=A0AAD3THA3_NEPGR|nr:hypothetical protein Nepgr_031388 [Nepenthes gracilis]
MDCSHFNTTITGILGRTPRTRALGISCLSPASRNRFDVHKVITLSSPTSHNQNPRKRAAHIAPASKTGTQSVRIKTLDGCKIGISNYTFEYNAIGGGGTGYVTKDEDGRLNESVYISFDQKTVHIPPVNSATATVYGWPFPPFMSIEIVPETLQGNINEKSGKVDFKLKANFWFSIGNGYKAPPLMVETVLTSEESQGMKRRTRGRRLNRDGKCRLLFLHFFNNQSHFCKLMGDTNSQRKRNESWLKAAPREDTKIREKFRQKAERN